MVTGWVDKSMPNFAPRSELDYTRKAKVQSMVTLCLAEMNG